jgi:proteic killer suppression protein
MIRSFRDNVTEMVFSGVCPKGFPANILRVTRRKLLMVDAARELKDLKVPPNNKLHPLQKDREGQHAIWINDQYRVCFEWHEGDAYNVEIIDYH